MMSGLLLLGLIALILAVVAQLLNRDVKPTPPARVVCWTLVACVLATTVVDLWLVSRVVTYTNMVADPPIDHLANSPVRQFLGAAAAFGVFAPGANLPSALAAATPVYLTFGPVEYVDPKLVMPENPLSARIEWLRRAGVTHVLSFNPLTSPNGRAARVQGFDPLLNPAWARYREPLYLYELRGSGPRRLGKAGRAIGSAGHGAFALSHRDRRQLVRWRPAHFDRVDVSRLAGSDRRQTGAAAHDRADVPRSRRTVGTSSGRLVVPSAPPILGTGR